MTTIFVFAYYSFKDPVFQSAVLPYLKIVKSDRLRFVLLTWEQSQFKLKHEEVVDIKEALCKYNILWYKTTWHSGKLKAIKKAYDLAKGLLLSTFLIKKYKAAKIYSEGVVGGVIGHYLSKITVTPHIIHTFEPHADYMADSGVWTKTDWEYKLLKKLEIPMANHAGCIITATQAYKEILEMRGVKTKILVAPSCIDTNYYRFYPEHRDYLRKSLGIKNDQTVIVYLGKLGGMYMDDEIFQFFRLCINQNSERFFFFLFTDEKEESVNQRLRDFGISRSKVLVKYLTREEVPKYLSAADIGFCGIRPIPSRRYSSPIKNGEYWACGLPIIIPSGISDDYLFVEDNALGIILKNLSDEGFKEVIDVLKDYRPEKNVDLRTTCSIFAEQTRSLKSNQTTFSSLFNDVKGNSQL